MAMKRIGRSHGHNATAYIWELHIVSLADDGRKSTRKPRAKRKVFYRFSSNSAVFTQHRSTSATLHAWAMQPRGVKGGSASKISLIEPTHASSKCGTNPSKNFRAPALSLGCTFNQASTIGPII